MICKALSPKLLLRETVSLLKNREKLQKKKKKKNVRIEWNLHHGAHGTVDDEDLFREQLMQQSKGRILPKQNREKNVHQNKK